MTLSKGEKSSFIFRNWYWVWIVNALFVGAMVGYLFFPEISWLRRGYRGISLIHEMSYAVWWSGMCLLAAGIIFSKVGSLVQVQGGRAWIWYVIAAAMIALSLDEMGSFHEAVSIMAGWYGLLPFGIIFTLAFGSAWFWLIRYRETRWVAVLIMLGFCGFVSVAGLEYVEHNVPMPLFWAHVRWVVEEALELVSVGLLMMAGLIGVKAIGGKDVRFGGVTSVVDKIIQYPWIITVLFLFQIVITARLFMPKFAFFSAGNPAGLFPVILFFCLGILALQRARQGIAITFWRVQSAIFFIASAMQMYNLNILFNRVARDKFLLFLDLPGSWILTVIPFVTLFIYTARAGYISWRRLLVYLTLFFMTFLIADPVYWFSDWREYLYFIFSSVIAYFCYLLMRQLMMVKAGRYDDFDGISVSLKILKYPFVWFVLLAVHIVIVAVFVSPNHLEYTDYPSLFYPSILFFCLGVLCSWQTKKGVVSLFWLFHAVFFFFVSALQLDSFTAVVQSLTGVSIEGVKIVSRSWLVVLLPFISLGFLALMKKKTTLKRILFFIVVLFLVYVFVQPDLKFPYRIEYYYFIFSGVVAYCCYLLVQDMGLVDEH